VQDDLETLLRQDNRCLLRNLSADTDKFLMLEGTEIGKKMEGSYLYFDSSASVWIRSGKVCNRTFDIRHAEHAKGATLPDRKSLKSNFYSSYPSREAMLDTSEMRLGYFDNLLLRCAIGYSRSKQGTIVELTSSADGSLFHWDGPVLEKVEKLNFKGSKNLEERQLHMVGYLLELCYDLAIPPADSVSRNPGFETALGIFGSDEQ